MGGRNKPQKRLSDIMGYDKELVVKEAKRHCSNYYWKFYIVESKPINGNGKTWYYVVDNPERKGIVEAWENENGHNQRAKWIKKEG